ncbi:MAG: tRNA adenosine(34) deaminase TadA [Eubacterium sp.]|nr:tRNA adenosine(34) deaminase TadA [Eubacterium sp.]
MSDEFYMKKAYDLACKAYKKGETPIGCVIVKDEKIIGSGYNLRNTKKDALMHAEMMAIKKACKKTGDWRLEECTLYVTLEPCPMCAGAIVQARIPKVVMGVTNPKAGCAGSVIDLFNCDGLNHRVELTSGVMGSECSKLMKDFFKELRAKKKAQ